ncbi:hypothetical protein ACFFRR_008374 [Megaselia abdita]
MFYVVSCKVDVGRFTRTEVFVCPVKWIKKDILYWPNPERKVSPSVQCKNYKNYKLESSWLQYSNFKILRNKKKFANFDEATKAEIEELKEVTEKSQSSSASSEDEEQPQSSNKAKAQFNIENVMEHSRKIPQILKRPVTNIQSSSSSVMVSEEETTCDQGHFSNIIFDDEQKGEQISAANQSQQFSISIGEHAFFCSGDQQVSSETIYADQQALPGNESVSEEAVDSKKTTNSQQEVLILEKPSEVNDSLDEFMATFLRNEEEPDLLEQVRRDIQNPEKNANPMSLEESIVNLTKIVSLIALKQVSISQKLDDIQTLLITPRGDDVKSVCSEIPVKTVEELKLFENKLSDQTFKSKLIMALCYKHVDDKESLTNMVLYILNSILDDTVLLDFTFSGESKLYKAYKLVTFPNVCDLVYAVFVYGASDNVTKCILPTKKSVDKALSAAVRHAQERVKRAEDRKRKLEEKINPKQKD